MTLGALLVVFAALGGERATLVGRATLGGEPAAGAKLWLYRRSLAPKRRIEKGEPFGETRFYWNEIEGPFDPFWLAEPVATIVLPQDGRFEVGGLRPRNYRLVIEDERGNRRALDPLVVPDETARVDLGDVELERACRIEGRVLLPDGVSGRGWTVTTMYLFHERRVDVSDDGTFALDGLQPTLHRLHVAPPAPTPGRDVWRTQRVAGGETARIEMDARELRGCTLTLAVRVNGVPERGARARLTPLDFRSWPCEIGPTDDNGCARAWSPTLGRARAEVTSELGLPLGRVRIEESLKRDADELRALDFNATHLVLGWPPDARFATLSRIELNGSARSGDLPPFRVVLDSLGDFGGDFGCIAPGKYELTLRLYSNQGDVAAFRKKLEVPAGPRFVCDMAPADSR